MNDNRFLYRARNGFPIASLSETEVYEFVTVNYCTTHNSIRGGVPRGGCPIAVLIGRLDETERCKFIDKLLEA